MVSAASHNFTHDRTRWALPDVWEQALVVAIMLAYTSALLRIVLPGEGNDPSLAFRLTHFVIYGIVAGLIARKPEAALDRVRGAPLLVALLVLPALSTLWSIDPMETVQRTVAVLGSSLFAVYLATQLTRPLLLRLLAINFAICAFVSLLVIAFVPSIGIAQDGPHAGGIVGAFGHKNHLGQMTALGGIVCLLAFREPASSWRIVYTMGVVINGILLLGSGSLTAQILFVASAIGLVFLGRSIRFITRHAVVFAVSTGVFIAVTALSITGNDLVDLLTAMGRDATMSSRIPIWQNSWPFITERWLLGYGYETFWSEANPAVKVIERHIHFRPFHAHNGYLELWLAIGIIGVITFAVLAVHYTVLAAKRLHRLPGDPLHLLAFVYAFLFLLYNLSENAILIRNTMPWILFALLYLDLLRPESQTGRNSVVPVNSKTLKPRPPPLSVA
jgi:exopolysaccharide production protein ExoQ